MSARIAVIRDSNVVNVVLAREGWSSPDGLTVPVPDGVAVGPGWLYADGDFIAPPVVITWDDIREQRDAKLAFCDWTQVADAPVDQQAWAVYRQELRDVPQDFGSPDAVVWPTPPA